MIIIQLPIKCTEIVISQKILDFVFLERFQSDSIESHFRSTLIFYSVVVSLNQIQFTKSKIKITSTKSKTTLPPRKIKIFLLNTVCELRLVRFWEQAIQIRLKISNIWYMFIITKLYPIKRYLNWLHLVKNRNHFIFIGGLHIRLWKLVQVGTHKTETVGHFPILISVLVTNLIM